MSGYQGDYFWSLSVHTSDIEKEMFSPFITLLHVQCVFSYTELSSNDSEADDELINSRVLIVL